ncbi:MAG: hypothetical protein LBB91_03990 [Clostridiales bacterium]|nr:hypothetical protein [Clostridiales bacterium]
MIYGNQFYGENEDKLEELGRRFYVNSPTGFIAGAAEPGSSEQISTEEIPVYMCTFRNGDIISIRSTYCHNGKYWGVTYFSHIYQPVGWYPMDQLLMIYESQDFEKENINAFQNYTGSLEAIYSAQRVVLWQWPGSDREKRVFEMERYKKNNLSASYAYQDYEGRLWVLLLDMGWVCLSDPENSNIPAFNPAPKPIKWSPKGRNKWESNPKPVPFRKKHKMGNFTKSKKFIATPIFKEQIKNSLNRDKIIAAYQYGIIDNDFSYISFDPERELNGGDSLIIAARIHAYYKYGKEVGSRLLGEYNYGQGHFILWKGSADYCKAEGLLSSNEIDSYAKEYSQYPLTRAQTVHLWASILKPKDMKMRNNVLDLPDVNANTTYAPDIFLFYQAGITEGVDSRGSFMPEDSITIEEAAVIIVNMIEVKKRYTGRVYTTEGFITTTSERTIIFLIIIICVISLSVIILLKRYNKI